MKIYLLCAPLFAYLIAGFLKFIFNWVIRKQNPVKMIGLGGFPSTHTSIASSVFFVAFMSDGPNSSVTTLGLGFMIIVIIDALDLRVKISEHAKLLNKLSVVNNLNNKVLREKIGHKVIEVLGGIILGFFVALFLTYE